jgi:hypothetical protein
MRVKFKNDPENILYEVYAIEINSGRCKLYPHSNPESPIPYAHSISDLDVVDSSHKKDWVMSSINYKADSHALRIASPEWANDPDFYWDLTEDNAKKLELYKAIRVRSSTS